MKNVVTISGLVTSVILFVGCFGLPFPEKNGGEYLVNHGYLFTDRVVNGEKLDHSQVLELSTCKNVNVRFLVARNPYLTHDEIDLFIHDKDAFVRSGTALNVNLSPRQIDILTGDVCYDVLAENPSLSEEALLRIRRERNPALVSFAMNPNCPESIRQEILNSNDDLAKKWLKNTDEWKKEGIYKQDKNSRWYRALKSMPNIGLPSAMPPTVEP